MNFLLVTTKDASVGESYVFPLGMAYVSSSLKKAGINVKCINTNHDNRELADVLFGAIVDYKIDVVMTGGMSVMFSQINDVVSISKTVKPNIITIVGGPIATCDPELALRNMEIDYCVLEEGEITAVSLAQALITGKETESVEGIAYLGEDGQFIKTLPRVAIEPLDELPFPDYEGFEFTEYLKVADSDSPLFKAMGNMVPASIITSRSCPFSCTFCYHPLGKKYRQRTLDNVFEELDILIGKYNVNFIDVMDELFSINKVRMYEFAERIKKYNIKWQCQLRVNDVNDELLEILKSSGLSAISYGVESIDNNVLKSMLKKTTKEKIEKALELTRKAKIMVVANLLFGDVEDSEETISGYIKWKLKNKQYPLNLVPIKLVPDAPLYRQAIERGKITNKFDFMRNKFPYLNMTKMDDDSYHRRISEILNINQYDVRMFLVGKMLFSDVVGINKKNMYLYDVSSECPECKKASTYSNLVQNGHEKYSEFVCQHCFQRYKLPTASVFKKNYSFLDRLKFNFVHFVLFHYNKNYQFKKWLKQNELCYGIFVKFVDNLKYSSRKA